LVVTSTAKARIAAFENLGYSGAQLQADERFRATPAAASTQWGSGRVPLQGGQG
jgi:hypothetical protein